jgi:dUTP pyrophosphatase
MVVDFVKLNVNAQAPTKAHADDAGFDLYSLEDLTLRPHAVAKVNTGIAIGIPAGHVGYVYGRSGMSLRGVSLANGVGVVDAGYHGELTVILQNSSQDDFHISVHDRVAQIVIMPVPEIKLVEVSELPETMRGSNGFGSSGV